MSIPNSIICNTHSLLPNSVLEIILSYLYSLRNEDQPAQTIDEIVNGVQNTYSAEELSYEEIQINIRRGSKQGLFSLVCTSDINEPIRYAFNRNAPLVNTKNRKYLCPGATLMSPGTCCYKPCRCSKGSVSICGSNRSSRITETVTIPGVPGSFNRVVDASQACLIPI